MLSCANSRRKKKEKGKKKAISSLECLSQLPPSKTRTRLLQDPPKREVNKSGNDAINIIMRRGAFLSNMPPSEKRVEIDVGYSIPKE